MNVKTVIGSKITKMTQYVKLIHAVTGYSVNKLGGFITAVAKQYFNCVTERRKLQTGGYLPSK
ncbi:hypothetical protein TUM17387_19160 [Shewanella carassii]|uniref:Uncharacterized protein n=1 Tax=Shewanella carassii TaxID=1987584 RepID=A0ABQ1SYJ4_9GAMM|nr:hypothetical protein TUM17387_19160 [Shewanella carassii]GGE66330.1 hypothetical protein GCM10011520_03810 [Shewanella carassii]